ncbi:GreA/GreB family elongation factor [Chloroflexota bacterium]
MPTTHLTRPGYEKLQQELEYLRTVKRPEMAARLHEATDGDSWEADIDAGYINVRHDQAFLEGRISELERLLSNPVVKDKNSCEGAVDIGATVTIKEGDLEPEVYIIVGPAEASPNERRISHESPLGSACSL